MFGKAIKLLEAKKNHYLNTYHDKITEANENNDEDSRKFYEWQIARIQEGENLRKIKRETSEYEIARAKERGENIFGF
ncbi:MAG: hypothetical protein KJ674_01945 [Nanoarchaeota archaeon]|nr:hypothetical protein [Nanoarchaeota archaeon]